ncbi:20S-pre-rRNA D-site endonuclease NOB1 [Magnaporthiopsis poae ATCC 64411]|uniref:20S-pre-rRNA D-site endonuclease NOB1 n=1 Tax=Magnaporthiopsis poae (strain ATCC 64411 / 73-15) TaxID=644358 RepID=A0A0C4DVK8_MAGP6|nr:20S-pre-rRNA D-site endonuclease NOB1 [Magnaporthiopsis poae ATCC 64411]
MATSSSLPQPEVPPAASAPPSAGDAPVASAPAASSSTPSKPINSLVLDAGPLIKGDPAISTLIAQAEELYTIPAVLDEIRDEQTRSRINTTLLPFLKLRSPRPDSVKFVSDFARRTGDLEVLSRPDIHLIALTYELEIERNGGDWRLRNEPNQKRVNGSPPKRDEAIADVTSPETEAPAVALAEVTSEEPGEIEQKDTVGELAADAAKGERSAGSIESGGVPQNPSEPIAEELQKLDLETDQQDEEGEGETPAEEEEQVSDDGDGEWITPSNIKRHQAKDNRAPVPEPIQRVLQACILTSDFAMQNVAMRINLNVVSPTLARITQLKSWVLRCHGCFAVTRKMDKQFCPSCGQATLTRVSCSTDSAGNFKVHLKRNFQWNNRGNVFSIPKPVHGNASGKKSAAAQGGGKNGWGRDLILAEDQKEYQRKADEDRRARVRDLMDEDYLPGILTGDRVGGNGKIKVGAGRNVNGKKRR